MAVRCKFQVTSIKPVASDKRASDVELTALYDQSIPADQRFRLAHPTGKLLVYIINPDALEQLKPGNYYYVEITPAE